MFSPLRSPSSSSLLWALLLTFSTAPIALAAENQPNIIYIMADDLGYGDIGCYGQQKFETPRLDQMAAQGMRFTQHYAGCTVCAPTRCSLMTGLHTGHCEIRGNAEVKPVGQEPISDKTVTVAELLKQAGYKTGAFGKWGLGYPGSEGDPTNQGFDVFYGYNCQRNAHTYYPEYLFSNTDKVPLDGRTYSHDLIMEQALKFIRENQQGPFFCYMPVTIPHAAMHVPDEYSKPFREKFSQFEDLVGKYKGPNVNNPVAAFAGMITKLDQDVGRVIDLLHELEIADNTVVMFTSDNGPHQEGGHQPDFFDSNGPFSGHKRDLTDGGIRVPMIAYWPGKIQPGSQSDLISAHWDVLPTLCDLAGTDAPRDLDGISFVPTLLGQAEQPRHDYLYWEFHERGGKRAVRMGPWKAIQRQMNDNPEAPIALYNIEEDIDESEDVSLANPIVVQIARQIFNQAHTPSSRFPFKFEK